MSWEERGGGRRDDQGPFVLSHSPLPLRRNPAVPTMLQRRLSPNSNTPNCLPPQTEPPHPPPPCPSWA